MRPLAYYDANTAKSRDLIACAVAAGVRSIIVSSTAAIYGNPDGPCQGEHASSTPLARRTVEADDGVDAGRLRSWT